MIVSGHKAVGADPDIPDPRRFDEELKKAAVVCSVKKDLFTASAPVHHMIPGIRIFGLDMRADYQESK
jgi:hypothetical protein